MNDDQANLILGVRAQQSVAASVTLDLPTSARQLARALAHMALGGSLLWALAAAACLAHSL
jgi:hypothetical protein